MTGIAGGKAFIETVAEFDKEISSVKFGEVRFTIVDSKVVDVAVENRYKPLNTENREER
jgi:hypothetical protein